MFGKALTYLTFAFEIFMPLRLALVPVSTRLCLVWLSFFLGIGAVLDVTPLVTLVC